MIDQQSTQIDIDGDGQEDIYYYEGYDLNINPTPNPPPSIFMNNGTSSDGVMLRSNIADLDRKRNQDFARICPEMAQLIEYKFNG